METEDLQKQQEEQEAAQASQQQEPGQGTDVGPVTGQEDQPQEPEQPQPVQPEVAAATQTAGEGTVEDAAPAPEDADQANGTVPEQPQEKMIPQSEVNRILQSRLAEVKAKAREEAINELKGQTEQEVRNGYYTKYGVGSDDELDSLFANGQKYGVLNEACGASQKELEFERAENALLRSGIKEDRFNDVRAWAQFNNQPITPDTIQAGLQTHPEWLGTAPETVPAGGIQDPAAQNQIPGQPVSAQKPSVIQKLGGEPGGQPDTGMSEKQRAFAAMGIDYRK